MGFHSSPHSTIKVIWSDANIMGMKLVLVVLMRHSQSHLKGMFYATRCSCHILRKQVDPFSIIALKSCETSFLHYCVYMWVVTLVHVVCVCGGGWYSN